MPKIGYYTSSRERSSVTSNWVQKKLNAAKWLLNGNIDEENFISNNLQKNVIKDFPSEVISFDNSMKFFANYVEGDSGEYLNPYRDIFLKLSSMCKASPDVAIVGGTFDSEMSAEFSVEQNAANDEDKDGDSCSVSETYNLKRELEVPPNYIPMNWSEFADIMISCGYMPKNIKINSQNRTLYLEKDNNVPSSIEEKKAVIYSKFNKSWSDYVETMNYWRDGDSTNVNVNMIKSGSDRGSTWGHDVQAPVIQAQCSFPKCELVSARNMLVYETFVKFEVNLGRIEPTDDVKDIKYLKSKGFSTVKLIPEVLCKVV